MKRFAFILSLGLLYLSCSSETKETADDQPDEQQLQVAAQAIIGDFSRDLKSELMSAIADGGPANAINVCNTRAPEIAAKLSHDHIKICRVSDRARNAQNRATEEELAVLKLFTDTTGTMPAEHSAWYDHEGKRVYAYYKPIMTNKLCLKCHGSPDDIDEATMAALTEKYPDDQATGYGADQLRGMFVVEFDWPEAEAALAKFKKE